MKRRFSGTAFAAGLAGLLIPLLAGAFNLGDAQVRSELGQPLDIIIPIELHRTDAPGDYLRVELSPWQDYADAGIEEVFDRQEAKVTVGAAPDGTPQVRVRTLRPVLEPIVPIMLDARLGNVMVRRSYSLLLDPPANAARASAPVPARQARPAASSSTGIATAPLPASRIPSRPSAPRRPVPAIAPAPQPPPARRVELSNITVVVQPGETLGELSQRVRRNPDTRLERMMSDIYAANPHAFGGSPDLMWAGGEIRVPLEAGVSPADYAAPLPARATTPAPTVMVLQRFAGKLSTSLSSVPTPSQIASAALSRLWLPGAAFPASRLSVSLSSLPDGIAVAAAEPVPAPEASRTVVPAQPQAATPAAAAPAAPVPELDSTLSSIDAAAAPAAGTGQASGGFWRTAIGLAMLLVLAWMVWFRRREEPVAHYRPSGAAAKPRLPPVSRTARGVELKPVSAADARAEATILAAAEAKAAAEPVLTARPKQVPVELDEAPPAGTDGTDGTDGTGSDTGTAAAPAAEEPPLEFVLDDIGTPATATTPPTEPKAPPAKVEAARPEPAKVVALPGRRRPDDPKIEVVEKGLPESTGGLSGFYADVAQMLTAALESNPKRRDLRLKLLEVYFAAGMADEFLNHTRVYLEIGRGQSDEHWVEIAEMGRQLFPQHEWFASATPPVVTGDPKKGAAAAPEAKAKHNFNRYYEGVDQWKLRGALEDLAQQYKVLARDPELAALRQDLLQRHAGRPSPLVHLAALSTDQGGAQIYLKREPRHGNGHDHLINAVGQVALAKRMGRERVISATTNGLHGLAVAVIARAQKLGCIVYMDEGDAHTNHSRVLRMKELGAEIESVRENPNVPAADARRTAMTAWLDDAKHALYISSLASGPHPYPMIMKDALALVGAEARHQLQMYSQRPPTAIITGMTDGPAAIGIMQAFLDETQTRLYCAEVPQRPAAFNDRLVGSPAATVREHDWPREHAWLRDTHRVQYAAVTEIEANRAITAMYEKERLMLSREGAQVVAYALRVARELTPDHSVVVLLPAQNDADAHFVNSKLESEASVGMHRA